MGNGWVQDLHLWLEHTLGLSTAQQLKLLTSLAVVAVFWLLRRLILRIVQRSTEDARVQYRWKKTTAYATFFIALLVLIRIWFGGVPSLATYLGLLSAGVAIALRDPLVDLAGWAFILWRRPFEVGDRIQLGEVAGDVIDLRIFQFTVVEIGNWVHADQSTGRMIHIPNGQVFIQPLANYTKGFQFIWNEIGVLVTFESDWREAKRILQEIGERRSTHMTEEAVEQVRKAAQRYLIFYSKLTPRVYTTVEDSGVLLTLRYLCDPRGRRGSAEEIWEDVLDAFAEREDIDFAYPTRRYFDNAREGKPGARPSPSSERATESGP